MTKQKMRELIGHELDPKKVEMIRSGLNNLPTLPKTFEEIRALSLQGNRWATILFTTLYSQRLSEDKEVQEFIEVLLEDNQSNL